MTGRAWDGKVHRTQVTRRECPHSTRGERCRAQADGNGEDPGVPQTRGAGDRDKKSKISSTEEKLRGTREAGGSFSSDTKRLFSLRHVGERGRRKPEIEKREIRGIHVLQLLITVGQEEGLTEPGECSGTGAAGRKGLDNEFHRRARGGLWRGPRPANPDPAGDTH